MTHPLTDELIDGLACCTQAFTQPLTDEKYDAIAESMRAAHDKGADWQLEQVIEWIKQGHLYDLEYHTHCLDMIADLKKAMRPQEDNQ